MRLEIASVESYRARLDALDRVTMGAPGYAATEARHLTETILREAASSLDLQALEAELAEATRLDLPSLEDAAKAVVALKPAPLVISTERTIDPDEELKALLELTAVIRENETTLHRTESWLRLELLGDSCMTNLLVLAAASGLRVPAIVDRAELKLKHLSELTLTEQWGRVQREFAPTRIGAQLDPDSQRLPPEFLSMSAPEPLRRKLAEYIIHIKPSILADRYTSKVGAYPTDALGPARLLALNGTVVPLESDPVRLDLVRVLSRLSAVWTRIFGRPVADLAGILRLPASSLILRGSEAQDAAKEIGAVAPPLLAAVAVYQLRALLSTLERLDGSVSEVVLNLTRYKLGLEVSLPESRAEVLKASELLLQKQLCRYLLDHGLYAEGTKFGPFETDLVASVRALATVLEVKVYAANKPPTEQSLRANLAQLQDYMDKRPVRPQGVLVVYNLSPVLLVGPNRWLRGRYWITCINMGEATGSRRRGSLVLEEGSGNELIASFRTEAVQAARRRSRGGRG